LSILKNYKTVKSAFDLQYDSLMKKIGKIKDNATRAMSTAKATS
jgi:hypothetical protein